MELLQDLKVYLGDDYDEEQEHTLLFCIRRAIRSFTSKRNYPVDYSEDTKLKDMDRFYSCLFDLTLYWWNKQGVEFQNSHSENSTSRAWENESEIYAMHNVIPIARVI